MVELRINGIIKKTILEFFRQWLLRLKFLACDVIMHKFYSKQLNLQLSTAPPPPPLHGVAYIQIVINWSLTSWWLAPGDCQNLFRTPENVGLEQSVNPLILTVAIDLPVVSASSKTVSSSSIFSLCFANASTVRLDPAWLSCLNPRRAASLCDLIEGFDEQLCRLAQFFFLTFRILTIIDNWKRLKIFSLCTVFYWFYSTLSTFSLNLSPRSSNV